MATGLGGEQLWLSPTVANNVNPYDDQSGQGNNGTNNGSTVVADTSEGGTYAFDFINTSFQKIDISTLDLTGLSNFTWSAWIYDDSPNAVNTHSTFFSWSTTSAQEDILFIDYERSELVFQINDGVDGGNVYAQVNFQNWHHYCGTFDGSNPVATDRFKYYLDGVVQTPSSTFAYPSTLGNSGTNMGAIVGTYVSNQSAIFWFNGRQDDIRAYDRTITQAEITHLETSRGVLGPPSGATHYNPFKTHAFTNNFQQRLR